MLTIEQVNAESLKFHLDADRVFCLACWLDSEFSYFEDVKACLHYFNKPWHWEPEFRLWLLWRECENNLQRRVITDLFEDGMESTAKTAKVIERLEKLASAKLDVSC